MWRMGDLPAGRRRWSAVQVLAVGPGRQRRAVEGRSVRVHRGAAAVDGVDRRSATAAADASCTEWIADRHAGRCDPRPGRGARSAGLDLRAPCRLLAPRRGWPLAYVERDRRPADSVCATDALYAC